MRALSALAPRSNFTTFGIAASLLTRAPTPVDHARAGERLGAAAVGVSADRRGARRGGGGDLLGVAAPSARRRGQRPSQRSAR